MHIICFVADLTSSLLCALLCPLSCPEVLTSATSVKINNGRPEKNKMVSCYPYSAMVWSKGV